MSTTTTDKERAALVEYLRTRATITIEAEAETEGPEGHFASGDDEYDATLAATIRAEAEWNVWAWCSVKVRAEYLGHTGTDYLGACNYSGLELFKADAYYANMVDEALGELAHSILQDREAVADLAEFLKTQEASE